MTSNLSFDLQLELRLRLPEPPKGGASRPAASPSTVPVQATRGVPVEFAVVMKKLGLPKIKIQIKHLNLKCCARVTHDLREDELSIGTHRPATLPSPHSKPLEQIAIAM